MPPPNVTAKLHVWHSIMLTLEDIMTRYHRMKWDSTLLLPWTDHAWISTQVKVEEKLAKEWKNKHNISREEFLEECWEWTRKYGWEIQNQFRKMWVSCDWTKEKFTLDPDMNEKVSKAFVDLYNKWLIYRGEYMVNYDPVLDTVVSDQEVIYQEEKWYLYHITYFVSWSDNEIVVATTRPETLLWDVAVAVNPKDKRYKKLLKAGKNLILPIVNLEIPLIADEMVDMEFWTWAVKITPAHDPADFQVAQRHNLPLDRVVIWKNWKMTKVAWIFEWQDYKTARENIVELLKSKGNLLKIENYTSKVWYWERSHSKIETIISKQWFVKIDPIAKKVIRWYKNKDFEIIPKKFNKIFEDWIYNLRDWCISRQLIWWHQIPVWYGPDWEIFCAEKEELALETAKAHYKDENIVLIRDPDVLDTWFSSALWPFAVLNYNMDGWEQNKLVKQFYPASVLETWHDIIFFWVIRMLLFGYEFTEQTPFKTIYFHWLVRDKLGRKMSKSLWNWVNPTDMIAKYGTDALRLTLSIWNTPWNDLKFDEENVENNMFFVNKLWNASRFVYCNIDSILPPPSPTLPPIQGGKERNVDMDILEEELIKNYDDLMFHEKWILSRIKYLSDLVTASMEKYSFSEAGQELQAFTKNEFCDYYIEEFKLTKNTSKYWNKVITYVLDVLLKLLHPYIPFVTEEIYNKLWFKWFLIESSWPNVKLSRDIELEKNNILLFDLIKEIRNIRAENNILPNKSIWLKIFAKWKSLSIVEENLFIIAWIVKSDNFELVSKKLDSREFVFWIINSSLEVYVDTSNALDIEKEEERLKSQILDIREYISILDIKLLNDSFILKAPEKLVRAEMEKKEQAIEKLKKLEDKLLGLKS
jgi:valyl-tRNA synthetase